MLRKIIKPIYSVIHKSFRKIKLLKNKHIHKITKEKLNSTFRELGIHKGQNLYVHSAMSSLGYIEGGPKTIINTLLEIIGKEGTLIMPTFTHIPKDKSFSPDDKCWAGVLPETLRHYKNAHRSLHPIHSVVAIGPKAIYFTKDHEKSLTPFGSSSPYAKFGEDCSIIQLGIENNSIIHLTQERVNLPKLFLKGIHTFHHKKTVVKTKLHHPKYSITYILNKKPCTDVEFFIHLYKRFEKAGLMKSLKLGKGICRMIDGKTFITKSEKYLKENLKKYEEEYKNL